MKSSRDVPWHAGEWHNVALAYVEKQLASKMLQEKGRREQCGKSQ